MFTKCTTQYLHYVVHFVLYQCLHGFYAVHYVNIMCCIGFTLVLQLLAQSKNKRRTETQAYTLCSNILLQLRTVQ